MVTCRNFSVAILAQATERPWPGPTAPAHFPRGPTVARHSLKVAASRLLARRVSRLPARSLPRGPAAATVPMDGKTGKYGKTGKGGNKTGKVGKTVKGGNTGKSDKTGKGGCPSCGPLEALAEGRALGGWHRVPEIQAAGPRVGGPLHFDGRPDVGQPA